MISAKVFDEIASLILESCSYNRKDKYIEVDTDKIRSTLCHINGTTVSRIIDIAERIAHDQSLKIETSPANIEYSQLKNYLILLASTVLKCDCSKSEVAKIALIEQIDTNSINNDNLVLKIQDCVNNAFSLLTKGFSIDQDNTLIILSDLKTVYEELKFYRTNIKVSNWLEEIIVRQEKNNALVEQNIECIDRLRSKASVVSIYEEELGDYVKNADSLREAISQNNNLLLKIQREIADQISKTDNLIKLFEEFQTSIADGIILKVFEDDKDLTRKLESFSSILSNEFNIERDSLAPYSFKTELRQVNLLEALIGSKSSIGNAFRGIDKTLPSLKNALVRHQDEMLHPIPQEIFIYERSNWCSWKANLANISKFFIGHDNHVKIYGLPDPIEELRRIADDNVEGWFQNDQACIA